MFTLVLPVFLVIVSGYIFAKRNTFTQEATKLINNFVLFVALPALLFLAVAKAEPQALLQWEFVLATLSGILCAYLLGLFIAKALTIRSPDSSIIAMGACYGTTGYMGIPIAIAVLGEQAAVPAAIATILHNIPAIMAVIITYGVFSEENVKENNTTKLVFTAFKTTLMNPLTLAVLAGAVFSLFRIPLPQVLADFAKFLGAAAGPTALFALGLGLAGLKANRQSFKSLGVISPIIIVKIIIQPLLTLLCALYLFNMDSQDIYFIVAIVMAAQPIGAGVFVFANQYDFFQDNISLAIIISLLATVISLPVLLAVLTGTG